MQSPERFCARVTVAAGVRLRLVAEVPMHPVRSKFTVVEKADYSACKLQSPGGLKKEGRR